MDNNEVARRIGDLHKSRGAMLASVRHKTKNIRPSEKAYWLADIKQDMVALEIVYEKLTGRPLKPIGRK